MYVSTDFFFNYSHAFKLEINPYKTQNCTLILEQNILKNMKQLFYNASLSEKRIPKDFISYLYLNSK